MKAKLSMYPFIAYKPVEVVDNEETGRQARLYRTGKGISLRAVARAMKLSAPFVSDLERGRRGWDGPRCLAYNKACMICEIQRIQQAMQNAHKTNLKLD